MAELEQESVEAQGEDNEPPKQEWDFVDHGEQILLHWTRPDGMRHWLHLGSAKEVSEKLATWLAQRGGGEVT
jgi:hypothetical protein